MLIFICCPKPLKDPEFNKIQYNAILSWSLLDIEKKIVIVGDEEGNEDFCSKHSSKGFVFEPNVEKNKYNTPLIPSIFKQGLKHAEDNDIIVYINCDIILCSSFVTAIKKCEEFIKTHDKYLLIGQRTDVDDFPLIDFSDENWEDKVVEVSKRGKLHATCGIDYFVFTKSTYDVNRMHPFAVGKCHWDRWLVGKCIVSGIATVDLTKEVLVIHQNGSYFMDNKKVPSLTYTAEVEANHFDRHLGRDITDSQYVFVDGNVSKR